MFLAMAIAACVAAGMPPAPKQFPVSAESVFSTAGQPEVLTLAEALALARTRSPLIEAARTRLRASIVARSSVPWLPNPSVELRGENFGHTPDLLRRDVFATVSQPVEIGGDRAARRAEAAATAGLAAAELDSTAWRAAFDVTQLYIDALRAREVMATLIEQRQGLSELVAMLAERVREGISAEADLRRFETEETRLSSHVTRASISLHSALLRLGAIVGQDVQGESLYLPALPTSPEAGPAVLETGIAARPDVQLAAARLQQAEAALALEQARRIPDLAVTAGYKRTDAMDTGVAGLSMAIPIFDRNRAGIASATGGVGAARLELQHLREQALAEARARSAAARELLEQLTRVERDLVTPAAVVRSAARSAFVEGRGDVLQLVDAERVYGEATREALELRLDAMLAGIHARLAIGESPLP